MVHPPPFKFIIDVLKRIYWWFKTKLFWKSVLASHRHWTRRTGIGSSWKTIGKDIEYSESLARWPEGPEQSKVAVRTKNGRKFDSVVFVVEANPYSSKYVHEETRTVTDVGEIPRIIILTGFPTYRTIVREGGIFSSYDAYRIRISHLVENKVGRYVNLETPVYTPIDQTIANHRHWSSWRGTPVNLSLIREKQEVLREEIWHKLGHPQLGLGWRRSGKNVLAYYMSVFALSDLFVRTIYWLSIFTDLRKFDLNDEDDPNDEANKRNP